MECYDAEDTGFDKDHMDRIPAGNIHYGDIVLVEANILRYTPSNTIQGTENARFKPWETWNTRLELKSLARLRRGPEIPVDVSSGQPNIDTDQNHGGEPSENTHPSPI